VRFGEGDGSSVPGCASPKGSAASSASPRLRVAETLDDVRAVTGRCHLLGGDRSGCLALDLDGPYRLIFKAAEWLEDDSGGLDWKGVKSVVVLEITDYH
jgi:toxin HigB-1